MPAVTCPACDAHFTVPDAALGKKAQCARCAALFVVHAASVPAAPAKSAAPSPPTPDTIRLACPKCTARIKVPAAAAGRRVKCPKCATILTVPGQAPARAAPPPKPAPRPASITCPSCGKSLPAEAKICVDCGVFVKTGRSLLITQDERLDEIKLAAEGTIRLLSWLIWAGIYPIASEAFGMSKPYVIRTIALVTIITSFAFLPFLWTGAPQMDSLKNLMLWGGNPQLAEQLPAELVKPSTAPAASPAPDETEDGEDEFEEEVDDEPEEFIMEAGHFQPMQLLTHAFLHAGILHLAGNLLFLLIFGSRVNALIGNLWTLLLYPVLAIVSGAVQLASIAGQPPLPMLGASGAIMGLAGMYLVLFPAHKVHMAGWWRWGILAGLHLTLRIFAVRGFWVVLFYIAFDVTYTILGTEDNVAHWAHLGGFGAGVLIAMILLITRAINARGGDLFSFVLGRHAWAIIGRPRA